MQKKRKKVLIIIITGCYFFPNFNISIILPYTNVNKTNMWKKKKRKKRITKITTNKAKGGNQKGIKEAENKVL